jgi:hypothetical protein
MLYCEALCGLFHDGMSRSMVLLNNEYPKSFTFNEDVIEINPLLVLAMLKQDFEIILAI